MNASKSGFSVLLILLLSAALSVACLSFMRTSTFLADLARARENNEYQYWAFRGLKSYAEAMVYSGDPLSREPLVFNAWPTAHSSYRGIIQFSDVGLPIVVTVKLMDQKRTLQETVFNVIK